MQIVWLQCSIQEAEALRDFGLKQPIAILPNGVNNEFIQTPYIENSVQTFREKHLFQIIKKYYYFYQEYTHLKE